MDGEINCKLIVTVFVDITKKLERTPAEGAAGIVDQKDAGVDVLVEVIFDWIPGVFRFRLWFFLFFRHDSKQFQRFSRTEPEAASLLCFPVTCIGFPDLAHRFRVDLFGPRKQRFF